MNRTLHSDHQSPIPWGVYGLLLLAAFAVYGVTLWNDYNFNDQFAVFHEEAVAAGLPTVWELLRTPYVAGEGFSMGYRPLARITFLAEYDMFGSSPAAGHFINILLYFAFSVLLWHWLKRWFPRIPAGLVTAIVLLFIAHPVHTEVVASLKNREELLAGIFYLLCAHSFTTFVRRDGPALTALCALVISFILGFLSKLSIANALFLPLIYLVLFPDRRTVIRSLLAFVVMYALLMRMTHIVSLWIPGDAYTMNVFENPVHLLTTAGEHIGFVLSIAVEYMRLLLWPFRLQWYYGFDEVPLVPWTSGRALLGLLAVLAGGIVILTQRRRRPVLAFGAMMVLLNLLMYTSLLLPYSGIVTERALFLSSIGICILVGYGGWEAGARISGGKYAWWPAIAVFVIWGGFSISRNLDWKDLDTLLLRDFPRQERSAHAHYTLGHAYYVQYLEKPSEPRLRRRAFDLLEGAVAIDSTYKTALHNLTAIHFNEGQYGPALETARQAYRQDPEDLRSIYHLANACRAMGRTGEERKMYMQAYERSPGDEGWMSRLSDSYFSEKEIYSGYYVNRLMLWRHPDQYTPYLNFGTYQLLLGDRSSAAAFFRKAVEQGYQGEEVFEFLNTPIPQDP